MEENTSGKTFSKKKKIIIAVIAVCAVLGIACGFAAGVLSKKNISAPDGTDIKGIEREWKNAESANISTAPDTTIKAMLLRQIKENDSKVKVTEFSRMKIYSDFRIYDMSFIDADKKSGACLMVFYFRNDKATLFFQEEYKDSSARAKLLSGYIREFDKDYEKYAKQAQGVTDSTLIYSLKND